MWNKNLDGDPVNPEWEHTLDGDYRPKGCSHSLDGDLILQNKQITTQTKLNDHRVRVSDFKFVL